MSTSISYKGNTIGTVDNDTKTLLTADKWLEDNIVLTDVTSGGGGGGGLWSFLPASAELVASKDEVYNLSADTSWDSWTPSTTSTTIVAAGATRGACSVTIPQSDLASTAIIGAGIVRTVYAYKSGTTMAAGYMVEKYGVSYSFYTPLLSQGLTVANPAQLQPVSFLRTIYHTSATATAIFGSGTYGAGATASPAMSASATSGTAERIIGYTRPALYARCNTTYFTTAAAAAVDSENTNIYCHFRLWQVDLNEHPLYAMFNYPGGLLID